MWPLTFQPQNHIISRISQVIAYTKFEHFGLILFWVMLRTNRQTNVAEHSNHADRLTRTDYGDFEVTVCSA